MFIKLDTFINNIIESPDYTFDAQMSGFKKEINHKGDILKVINLAFVMGEKVHLSLSCAYNIDTKELPVIYMNYLINNNIKSLRILENTLKFNAISFFTYKYQDLKLCTQSSHILPMDLPKPTSLDSN